jgi:hypothetical protein
LSTALHEIGHLLGLSSALPDAVSETNDGTYDLPPGQMNGNTAEVRTAVGDIAHLRPGTALMCTPCGATSLRRRPSAVDMLAMSSVGNWTNIDFPRKMFVDGQNFNAVSGWLDSQAPNSSDDAFVADQGSFFDPVELTADDTVGTLTVLETYLSTGSHRLTVNGRTLLDAGATLRVPAGGEIVTPELLVTDGLLAPQGGQVTVDGTLTIDDDGVFPADSSIQGHGTIEVAAGLVNNGIIRTSGGTLVLTTPSPLDPPSLNLDGDTGDGELDVNNGDLIVERALTDAFDNRINIGDDDTATFQVPWTIGAGGELRRGGIGGGTATLAGAEVTMHGAVIVSHLLDITAPIVLQSSADVSFQSGVTPTLRLLGTTTYRGPAINAGGQIIQNGDAVVEATTVIDPDFYDWDGDAVPSDTTVNSATLQINTPQIESGDPALNGYGGTATLIDAALLVTTAGPWRLDGTIDMDNSTVRGRGILNHGTLRGNGLVIVDTFTNDGTVTGDGGTLTLEPQLAFPDLDGASENGAVRATLGSIHVPGNPGSLFTFDGTISIGAGHEFRMDHFGIDNLGQLIMTGGTYVAPQLRHQASMLVRINDSTLQTDAVFENASTTQLIDADLIIDGSATFQPLASVTGSGALEFANGAMVDGEADLEVDVRNFGELAPGFSAGSFAVAGDFMQGASGALAIEIGGLAAGSQHDELVVDGQMSLAGELVVTLFGGHEPEMGNAYDILDFTSVVGAFDAFTFDSLPVGLHWNISQLYLTGELLVVAALSGDYNDDGTVDAADYVVWRKHEGTNNALPNDLIGGMIGAAQYGQWRSNFGQVIGGGSATFTAANGVVPEPAGVWLLILGLAAMPLRRRQTF